MIISGLNRHEAIKLKKAGLTDAEISRRCGITRERVRQILKGKPRPQKPAFNSKVMLTIGDVSKLLGVHANTVRRWSESGILKTYRIGPRGDRRFRREDIDNFLSTSFQGHTERGRLPIGNRRKEGSGAITEKKIS